jgi:hypothetical protein
MLSKLALRNVMRSARDYLVYFLTMMLVTAIMFAFHSLLFSREIQQLFEMAVIFAVLVGLATFFVVLIVAWLINYMVRFILEKRSREFGIYLLIGMKKKEISRLYMRESLLLGAAAFAGGLALGILLQQILLAILYSMIMMEYRPRLEWSMGCLITTAACYGGCYLLALLRCRGKFRKMNIHALMSSQKQNEEIRESHEQAKRWLLPLSGLFLLAFALFLFFFKAWNVPVILGFLLGLVLTIYVFYTGVAAWVICYIRRKGAGIFKGQNLFLLRQFSSKLKTLRFTLGTLTSLFVLALLGCAIALMFNDYQNQTLLDKWPFDVMVFSSDTSDTFREELDLLNRECSVEESLIYDIRQNGTDTVNAWLYAHLKTFGGAYTDEDGGLDREALGRDEIWAYYEHDTYLALSDYNRLREMAGLLPVELEEGEYLLHLKERIWDETGDFTGELEIVAESDSGEPGTIANPVSGEAEVTADPDSGTTEHPTYLRPAGIYTEPLSQDGHNGADYLLIVTDRTAERMEPYYRLLTVNLDGPAPDDLLRKLDALPSGDSNIDFGGHRENTDMACGTDNIVVYVVTNIVRDNLIPEVKFMLSSIIFALVYIGLVFVCVALTVLSVQQLSDSAKYRFRYQVLHQIGLGQREISKVILKQLAGFYLCPILFAALISGTISIYLGWKFNVHTGTHTAAAGYFGLAFLLFLCVYTVYFVVTYVGFLRNVLAKDCR